MKNLKEIRKQKGLTQTEVAKKLNISQQTYSDYENKKTEPDINKLIELSKLFNISLDKLLKENKDEINNNQHPRYSDNLIEKIKQLNEYNLMKVEGYVENMLEEQNRSNKNG